MLKSANFILKVVILIPGKLVQLTYDHREICTYHRLSQCTIASNPMLNAKRGHLNILYPIME
jgi:hypothetical protein